MKCSDINKGEVKMNEEKTQSKELLYGKYIEECVFEIRGQQVMLDSDVAYFFEIDVKRLNRQMKRNKERLPKDFVFN